MPRPRSRKRWEHPLFKNAYVIDRRGTCYTVIDGGHPIAIRGLKFRPENKETALEILDHRCKEETGIKSSAAPNNIFDAIKEYADVELPALKPYNARRHLKTFSKYLNRNLNLKDVAEIRKMITKNKTDLSQANATVRKDLERVRKLFEYCIEQEYMIKNPVTKRMIPSDDAPEKKIFTKLELEAIYKYLGNMKGIPVNLRRCYRPRREHEFKDQFVLFLKFITMTGCRADETLKIYWHGAPDIPYIKNSNKKSIVKFPDKIIIDGKRASLDIPSIREIPINIIPELYELLMQLKQYQAENSGKLFKWNSLAKPRLWLKNTLNALDIEEGRSLHALRNYAINWWEKELGFPAHLCAYLAGHDPAVRSKYYSHAPTADDIRHMLMFQKARE